MRYLCGAGEGPFVVCRVSCVLLYGAWSQLCSSCLTAMPRLLASLVAAKGSLRMPLVVLGLLQAAPHLQTVQALHPTPCLFVHTVLFMRPWCLAVCFPCGCLVVMKHLLLCCRLLY